MITSDDVQNTAIQQDTRASEFNTFRQFIEFLGFESEGTAELAEQRAVRMYALLGGLMTLVNDQIDHQGYADIPIPSHHELAIEVGCLSWLDGMCVGYELGRRNGD